MRTRSRMVKLVVLLSMALGSASSAALAQGLRVEDPHDFLSEADRFLGTVSFESAFRPRDAATAEANQCELVCDGSGCAESCAPPVSLRHVVTRGGPVEAEVETRTSTEPGVVQVSRLQAADWVRHHGNLLRWSLADSERLDLIRDVRRKHDLPQGFDERDYVQVDAIDPPATHALRDGTAVTVRAVGLTYGVWMEDSQSYWQVVTRVLLARDVPGVAQILQVETYPGILTTPTLRVLSFERP